MLFGVPLMDSFSLARPAPLLREEGSGCTCIVQLSPSPLFVVKPQTIEPVYVD